MQSTIVRRLRETGKRRRFIAPFLFTFANACLGLLSVLYALDDYYTLASYCLIAAAVVDSLDGRVARALGATSSLGMELDSLCDAISFCLAPAILLHGMYFYYDGLLSLVAVGIYLCAGLYRLAKFNITSGAQKNAFIGMPTPVGALLIALSVINYHWLVASWWQWLFASSYALMTLVAAIAFLMVSPVRFPTFKAGARDPLSYLAIVVTLLSTIISLACGYPVLLTVLSVYCLFSVAFYCLRLAYVNLSYIFC